MQVKIKKTKDDVKLPSYAHLGDAGLDVYSLENYELKPGERRIFDLGFALELPEDHVVIVKDKGSLPKHGGLHTMGGVFDSGYRGEVMVILMNLGKEPYEVKKGQKIAQLVIKKIEKPEIIEDNLDETERGDKGFGSSGLT